jgi:crotonobetainyl-CoA:carnitine CoA-transferase CaiB-like acyl-CoA transferase
MLINSPKLPNIDAIADTSRGKLSAHLDLNAQSDQEKLKDLIRQSHVFIQGYRPGSLRNKGFGPEQLAAIAPGLVYVSLSAYGEEGPWGSKRGFDSLVQTATGFNIAEALAAGSDQPKPMPVQILDYAAGFLMAFGAQVALARQATEGGSWHVRISLARTAQWLRAMGQIANGFTGSAANPNHMAQEYPSGFGQLKAMPHAAQFSRTPAGWSLQSMPPGSHPPVWPTS